MRFGRFETRPRWKCLGPVLKKARIVSPVRFQGRSRRRPTVFRPEMRTAGQRFSSLG